MARPAWRRLPPCPSPALRSPIALTVSSPTLIGMRPPNGIGATPWRCGGRSEPYNFAARRLDLGMAGFVALGLKALRLFAHKDQGTKPMMGFGDPIFVADEAAPAAGPRSSMFLAAHSLVTPENSD
jgi:hypothetical protein